MPSNSWKIKRALLPVQNHTWVDSQTATGNWWFWRREWAWTTNITGSSTTCRSPGATLSPTIDNTVLPGSPWAVSCVTQKTLSSKTVAPSTSFTTNPVRTTHSTMSTWSSLTTAELPRNGATLSNRTAVELSPSKSHRCQSNTKTKTNPTAATRSHLKCQLHLSWTVKLWKSPTLIQCTSCRTTPSSGAHGGITFSNRCRTQTSSGSASSIHSSLSCSCREWSRWSCFALYTRTSRATIKWIPVKTLKRSSVSCVKISSMFTQVLTIVEPFSGWKLVHGDVFRPPRKGMLLAVLLGSGVQVFCMSLITLAFACLGFLSPANRGALMTCAMILFVLLGTPAGYVSARVYKSFGGVKWKSNVMLTSMFSPGIVFGLFFVMNLVLWDEESSGAVPFSTLVAILALWFGVSVPLTFVGAYFGFRKRSLEHPVRTNQIPRQIPDQSIYTQPIPGIIMGGVLPFGEFLEVFLDINSDFFSIQVASSSSCSSFWTRCGPTRCTTCSASCSWCSWSSSLPARRRQFCCATSIYVQRTTIGGGEVSSPVVSPQFISSCTAVTTSWQSCRSKTPPALSSTLATLSSWCSSSSFSPDLWASSPASGSFARFTPSSKWTKLLI